MQSLLISLALCGQAATVAPPAVPAAIGTVEAAPVVAPAAVESVEDLKAWLLARLIVDMSFDVQKCAEVEKMIDTLNERQLRVLVSVYKERSAQQKQNSKSQLDASQQQQLNQAKLDLQQAEAYRDHLKREYDRQILQGHMTQNLVYQNIVNSQWMLYGPYSGYSTGSFAYSPIVYGGFGYPAAGFASPMMYANPYYLGGRGY